MWSGSNHHELTWDRPSISECGRIAAGTKRMLFITYYELANDVELDEVLEAGNRLIEEGHWPPEGMDVIRWDGTVNRWGVTIAEADDFETIYRAQAMWETLVPGMFAEIKTVPGAPVEEIMAEGGEVLNELAPPA